MLNMAFIRENAKEVREALRNRGGTPEPVDRAIALDEVRRGAQAELDRLKAERNAIGPEIARRKKAGEDATDLLAKTAEIAERAKALEARLAEAERALEALLLDIPNVPLPDVPVGKDAAENVEVRRWGERRTFSFAARPHWELAERLGLIDFSRGAKLAASHWPLFMGLGARLERAMIQWFLDVQTRENGYTEVMTPFCANRATMTGTGQLPKFESDMYRIDADDLFLIPTSEVTITNIYRDETIPRERLPIKFTAYSPCFRREAGAYGKDTRGIQRVHQFSKVEMVKLTAPEQEEAEHQAMVGNAEDLVRRLGLEGRTILLCTGDMGFASRKTYDIEVFAPVTGRWFECSSVSQFGDFQARRMNIRYRDEAGKLRHVHTLNGSGLATPRIWIALLETYQNADGSVTVPEALRPYMGGAERIGPAQGVSSGRER
jgi:seryl-tRNA synthetase